MTFRAELLDALLQGYEHPQDLLGKRARGIGMILNKRSDFACSIAPSRKIKGSGLFNCLY